MPIQKFFYNGPRSRDSVPPPPPIVHELIFGHTSAGTSESYKHSISVIFGKRLELCVIFLDERHDPGPSEVWHGRQLALDTIPDQQGSGVVMESLAHWIIFEGYIQF